jgi:hypothetical protein
MHNCNMVSHVTACFRRVFPHIDFPGTSRLPSIVKHPMTYPTCHVELCLSALTETKVYDDDLRALQARDDGFQT